MGWEPDPSGRHAWRYRDEHGRWTPRVAELVDAPVTPLAGYEAERVDPATGRPTSPEREQASGPPRSAVTSCLGSIVVFLVVWVVAWLVVQAAVPDDRAEEDWGAAFAALILFLLVMGVTAIALIAFMIRGLARRRRDR